MIGVLSLKIIIIPYFNVRLFMQIFSIFYVQAWHSAGTQPGGEAEREGRGMCPQVLFKTFGENKLARLKCKESRNLRAEH